MKILVTGATGFIGRALVVELLQQDFSVSIVVRSKATTIFPDEIKQFSKRFRDKLDIKVDLVINPSQRPFLSIDGDLEDSIKKVENDLSTIREQLGSIKDSNLPESYPNSYESGLNRSQTLCL